MEALLYTWERALTSSEVEMCLQGSRLKTNSTFIIITQTTGSLFTLNDAFIT